VTTIICREALSGCRFGAWAAAEKAEHSRRLDKLAMEQQRDFSFIDL
jgi:hypothetical protein